MIFDFNVAIQEIINLEWYFIWPLAIGSVLIFLLILYYFKYKYGWPNF